MRIFFEPKPVVEPSVRMSTWLPKDLKERLKRISEIEDVSLNQVCRVFLDLMTDQYDEENKRRNENFEETPLLYD